MIEVHCIRCGRKAPPEESDEFLRWEPHGDDLVCGGCMTQEELIDRAEFAADRREGEGR